MNKTQDEIVARIESRKKDDVFGFEIGQYLDFLDYEHAKPYFKDGVNKEQWDKARERIKSPADEIKGYMAFAWDKANNCRGLSAGRSIMHMVAWLWLDGKEWCEEIKDYEYYGKPQLVRICEEYDIDWKQYDDDHWTNNEGESGITAEEALAGQEV